VKFPDVLISIACPFNMMNHLLPLVLGNPDIENLQVACCLLVLGLTSLVLTFSETENPVI